MLHVFDVVRKLFFTFCAKAVVATSVDELARFCVVYEFVPVNVLALPKKVETVDVATFFTKSTVAICVPVVDVIGVGAVLTPDHELLADKMYFLLLLMLLGHRR